MFSDMKDLASNHCFFLNEPENLTFFTEEMGRLEKLLVCFCWLSGTPVVVGHSANATVRNPYCSWKNSVKKALLSGYMKKMK